ncbi:MAG TPA: lipopolysaccharide biosynthesis protein, partial [Pseudolabrys sp.]|nr:lipopolysaccharide biosynthesis protein [Pseudolabrys sp.]
AAPPEARIISRATPAIKPSYPKKLAIVLIAAFAAFTLSAGFVVTGALLAAPAPSYGYAYSPAVDAPRMKPSPQVVSPPLAPVGPQQMAAPGYGARTIDHVVRDMHNASDSGRVAVIGIVRNVGTTYAAITLARALAQNASVVLVDLAFSAPNLSVMSTDPTAPGVAELTRGRASFGDIITRDQYSRVHLVAAGDVGSDAAALSSSPMLATVIEALGRSYEYVVIDAGSIGDVAPDRIASLATRGMLVAADPSSAVTRSVREQLLRSGFRDVAVVAGGAEAVAA